MSKPRNIILMEEFENAMKGNYGLISFGVTEGDITLTYWQGSIVTNNGDIIEFKFICDDNFPTNPPQVSFDMHLLNTNKNIISICDNNGFLKKNVSDSIIWNPSMTIGQYLQCIKKYLD